MPSVYAVIMAGGRGERFWPLSTSAIPKPFIPLTGSSTLIQNTVARLDPLISAERVLVAIGADQEPVARKQLADLPAENFLVEPVGRDTAACIGYAALHVERRDPEASLLVLPADHHIGDSRAFRETLQKGLNNLSGASGVIFGVHPVRPETGYGYIKAEKPALPVAAWPVIRFVEKPDAERARRYLESGDFFWNSGIFLWRNRAILDLIRRFMPLLHEALEALRPLIGRDDTFAAQAKIFSSLQRISIDYGVLEKASGLRLVPVTFDWDDIGSWASLQRALQPDAEGNVVQGPSVCLESRGCVAYSDAGTIALFGLSDVVVVQARGKVLVCPKERAGELKKLVVGLGSR